MWGRRGTRLRLICCDIGVSDTASDPANDPATLRAVAEGLAIEAAEFVRRRRAEVFGAGAPRDDDSQAVRSKSTPTDPVTIVDTETERMLRARLAVLRPGEPIVGEEEGGSVDVGAGVPTWVLDPIDGTVNFVYGLEAYAVSVGVQVDGRSIAGAVANVPTGEVFSAALGHGAYVRRADALLPLRCTTVTELSMTLVGTGFGYEPERRFRQAQVLAQLLPLVRDVRRIGSCALDLCMVAAGRLDAYYEEGVHLWDWAAGALVAEEAGAWLRLPSADGKSGFIAAAAPGIAAEFDRALHDSGAG
jgi:myo-inositol-1(or 4)-monophosphatase